MADEGADAGAAEPKAGEGDEAEPKAGEDEGEGDAKQPEGDAKKPDDEAKKPDGDDEGKKDPPAEAKKDAPEAKKPEGGGGEGDQAIMIDWSRGSMKAGYAGSDTPTAQFPAIVGRSRHLGVQGGMAHKDVYVGDEANAKRGVLKLIIPVQNGTINDWDGVEKLINHTYVNEMRVASENYPVLLAVHPLTSAADRERIGRYLFETMNVPALQLLDTGSLAASATGRATAVVVYAEPDSVVPVYAGHTLPSLVVSAKPAELARRIHETIEKADEAIRAELYANVVLIDAPEGGAAEKLQKDLAALAPAGTNVQVAPPPETPYAAWVGGSMLASRATFKSMWITKEEFQKEGPAIIRRRSY